MNYRDCLQFEPFGERLRLTAATDPATASRLLADFRLSPSLATALTEQILPQLRCDESSDPKAVLLVGPRGAGKTHFLAAICRLAEDSEIAPGESSANPQAALPAAGTCLAGRFRVFRTVLVPCAQSLREIIVGSLQNYLRSQGIQSAFPLAAGGAEDGSSLVAMMNEFQRTDPERGLLIAIDDLDEFLAVKGGPELAADLEFLRTLGAVCRRSKLRVIATTLRPLPELAPSKESVTAGETFRPNWAEVTLGIEHLTFLLGLIVGKTGEQRALVKSHLAKFVGHYERMAARMDEFVALFPFHPDCLAVVDRCAFSASPHLLRRFSDALALKLDDTIDETAPGIISYDHFFPGWIVAASDGDPPEHTAVRHFVKTADARLDRCIVRVENRPIARRILHALALRRLGVADFYGPGGTTADELREGLCLFRTVLASDDETVAAVLRREVQTTLDELRRCDGGRVLALTCEDDRYDLRFRKFRRFNRPELFLHWANALPFLLLLLTGGAMLGSRFFQFDRSLLTTTVAFHKACALTWFLALPLSVLARIRPHLANLRTLCTWGAEDAAWMIQSLRALYHKSAVIPPADRFNTGQKINSALVVVYYFGFLATGVLMFAKGTILFPWYVHTALFFSALGSVGGHLFLAFVNPSTRIALGGIFHGWAPMKYIEHHHALSLPESLRSHAHAVSLRSIAAEVFLSRVEIGAMVGTLFLGVIGAYAFGQARLATAKQQFAKSFADVIQPSQLNTKHRIGPTADSCTKCHLYRGEIPDRNCEECHADVKARRQNQLGYHGTLEGDCRTCHREHREQSVPFIPLDQAKFDHNKALFRLAGKHTEVKCDDCHQRPRAPGTLGIYYLGLKSGQCTDCHVDRHAGQFKARCESCHSTAGWTGPNLNFHHERDSTFSLVGQHAKTDCRECHQPARSSDPLGAAKFSGTARDCVACHQDPHRQQFASRCADCHTPAGWDLKHLNFAHNTDASFQLLGKHEQVACTKCHRPATTGDPLGRAQFRELGKACADCHQSPHRGQFTADCTKCHPSPATWNVTAPHFMHDRDTRFSLLGAHASVECQKCHQPQPATATLGSARFTGLETSCSSCHTVDHPAWYGNMCTSCHTTESWIRKEPAFDHARQTSFELFGKHMVTRCNECHREDLLGAVNHRQPADHNCFSCHGKTEPHQGVLGRDCQKCHTAVGWKGEDLIFDHNTMASFVLNPDHTTLRCAQCHKPGKWKPLDSACVSCHPKMIGRSPAE